MKDLPPSTLFQIVVPIKASEATLAQLNRNEPCVSRVHVHYSTTPEIHDPSTWSTESFVIVFKNVFQRDSTERGVRSSIFEVIRKSNMTSLVSMEVKRTFTSINEFDIKGVVDVRPLVYVREEKKYLNSIL